MITSQHENHRQELSPISSKVTIPNSHPDTLLTLLLFIIPLIHLLIAPYTKVEESFNIQATHDILVYGTPTHDIHARLSSTYDHFTFPGAVPRTFLGAVFFAALGQPVVALVGFQHAQVVVRGLLGVANSAALLVFRRALRRAYGRGVANWWVVLTMSQFHVNYYLSRTLPNMYAFGLSEHLPRTRWIFGH